MTKKLHAYFTNFFRTTPPPIQSSSDPRQGRARRTFACNARWFIVSRPPSSITTTSTTRSTTTTPFIDTIVRTVFLQIFSSTSRRPPLVVIPYLQCARMYTCLFQSSAWKQRGSPIVGDASDAGFGNSVALSSDASALAIGALGHNDYTGYVEIYRVDDDGGGYSVRIGQTLNSDATDDTFGSSVDMTPDGTTVICGSPGYLNNADDRPGYVRVYSLEGDIDLDTDNWKQIGQDIVGEANGDNFGNAVSISEDGKTIAIGAPLNDGSDGEYSGHVRMYRLSDDGTTWVKIRQDIDGMAAGDTFGRSVSLSADGSTVAIGAPHNDSNGNVSSGRVNVYRIDEGGSSWERLGQSIDGDNEYDNFGWSVSLTPDGNTLMISTWGGVVVVGRRTSMYKSTTGWLGGGVEEPCIHRLAPPLLLHPRLCLKIHASLEREISFGFPGMEGMKAGEGDCVARSPEGNATADNKETNRANTKSYT
ncbi:hypothetical protein ACHAXA_004530 [Cyclostephanos tholiformis]|uniref:Uncharacterized protein n=1 Tax=Cyclostephanos tholiformis TaxID=382380 RepID=A0ABD3RV76_9STRA